EVILYPNPRDIDAILKLIDKTRPSLFPGVPTMYIAILRNPDLAKYDLRSVRACISGAAPLPNEVRRQFEAATGGRLVEGYGLTEASPVTHCNPINGVVKECIGIPFPDTDAKLVDPRPIEGHASEGGGGAGGARSAGDERVLEPSRGDRGGPPRRMAADRGHREDGRGWILLHRRPKEGPHFVFRLQRLPAGSRGSPVHASGGGRSRGDRHPGRLSRRVREGVRRPQGRSDRDGIRDHRLLQGATGGVQGAQGSGVRAGPAKIVGGQGPPKGAAREGAGGVAREGVDLPSGRA